MSDEWEVAAPDAKPPTAIPGTEARRDAQTANQLCICARVLFITHPPGLAQFHDPGILSLSRHPIQEPNPRAQAKVCQRKVTSAPLGWIA
ncbi:hypothetical protein MJO28_008920 [Puccinia striiformis f. sp. tritici]|uniref:Uncharacterized protein n=1 Tax=Puccinia striiformis f. sp. tritici TaxID=168172 RepID=A0ACC0ECR2_9BASI|nr:hypothetical protein MJO28_008920 [Puccinia striiformis f. sp. tritici]